MHRGQQPYKQQSNYSAAGIECSWPVTAEAILLLYLLDWLEPMSHHRLPLTMS